MQYRDEPVLSFRPIDAKESKPQNVRRLVRLQIFVAIVTVALLVMLAIMLFVVRPVRVKSGAMDPTYPKGSIVFVTREWGTPERGEVAAFTDRTGEIYVRRVIAHEGETVEINGGTLYVNGLALDEPYLKSGAAEIPDLPETTVPVGCVFVLADDRANATATGTVDLRSLLGVVRFRLGR